MKCTMETVREIWNDIHEDNSCIEVGTDREGTGLVEIRYVEFGDGKKITKERISFPPDQARMVAEAILKCADEMEKK